MVGGGCEAACGQSNCADRRVVGVGEERLERHSIRWAVKAGEKEPFSAVWWRTKGAGGEAGIA